MQLSGRERSLVIPREHGAWGILLVPLATGGSLGLLAGSNGWPLVPLAIVALSLFWLRTPVESWVGSAPIKARTSSEIARVKRAVVTLASIASAACVWLFWGGRNLELFWIGSIAAAAFAAQAIIRKIWRKARTAAQMIGAAGLTAAGPAAYYVVTGRLDLQMWSVWFLNFVFAANQIQFVQLRIKGAHAESRAERLQLGKGFLAAQVILLALLAAASSRLLWHSYIAGAFLPVLWRGFAWFVSPFQPLAVHTLGKRELFHAIVFGVLLVFAMA